MIRMYFESILGNFYLFFFLHTLAFYVNTYASMMDVNL